MNLPLNNCLDRLGGLSSQTIRKITPPQGKMAVSSCYLLQLICPIVFQRVNVLREAAYLFSQKIKFGVAFYKQALRWPSVFVFLLIVTLESHD